MKKLVLTLTVSLACLAAFGQGRIQFSTDSLHLAYYDPDPLKGGIYAGQPVWANNMPGAQLVADFYLGTSSSSLSLITTTSFSATAPGKWNLNNYTSPTIPGGTMVYVIAQIRDTLFAPPTTIDGGAAAQPFGSWYGRSQEFTFVLGTSTSQYPPMTAPNAILGGGLSTWAAGTYDMGLVTPGLANNRGAVIVSPVPEPTSFALAGLGAAAMLIFRRRK